MKINLNQKGRTLQSLVEEPAGFFFVCLLWKIASGFTKYRGRGEIVVTVSIVGEYCRKGFFGGQRKRARKKFFIISLQSTHAWYKIGIKVVESGAKWKKVVSADPFLEILVVTLAVPRCIDVSVADHLQGGKWMDDGGRLRQTLRAGD